MQISLMRKLRLSCWRQGQAWGSRGVEHDLAREGHLVGFLAIIQR